MLKGIGREISAELLHVLMSMGHGDDLVIVDVNYPSASIAKQTVHGRAIELPGLDVPEAARAILKLMPLDTFVPAPAWRMQVVDDPARILPVVERFQEVLDEAESRAIEMRALGRFDFYEAAKRAYAVIRTSDPGPYACFILRKGVITF